MKITRISLGDILHVHQLLDYLTQASFETMSTLSYKVSTGPCWKNTVNGEKDFTHVCQCIQRILTVLGELKHGQLEGCAFAWIFICR